ncbi:hypothetical protein GF325_16360 [Candidatus Bathyarchaeota archaeon]|nr:hypothetical protein [Candidatus Bathyarchaeota archaeon]
MVCWSDVINWRSIARKLPVDVTEEEKSEAIYELEEEKGHDFMKSLSQEEIEKMILEKLRELKGLDDDDKEKRKKRKKDVKHQQMYM